MLSLDRMFFEPVKRYNVDDLELTNIFVDPDPKKLQAYNQQRNANVPIVIDYGSHATKAVYYLVTLTAAMFVLGMGQ